MVFICYLKWSMEIFCGIKITAVHPLHLLKRTDCKSVCLCTVSYTHLFKLPSFLHFFWPFLTNFLLSCLHPYYPVFPIVSISFSPLFLSSFAWKRYHMICFILAYFRLFFNTGLLRILEIYITADCLAPFLFFLIQIFISMLKHLNKINLLFTDKFYYSN